MKEILLDVFSWSTGEYELTMTEPGKDDVIALNLQTEALIVEGMRRMRSWRAIYRGVGADLDSIPMPTGNQEALLKVELSEEEQELVAHANARKVLAH